MMEVIGVYHADGGLVGELKYIAGKLTGTTHCSLCDITHGWHPLGKSEWRTEIRKWGNLKAIHLNEQPAELATITAGKTPCVVTAKDGQYQIIINSAQLASCHGDIQALLTKIKQALSEDA